MLTWGSLPVVPRNPLVHHFHTGQYSPTSGCWYSQQSRSQIEPCSLSSPPACLPATAKGISETLHLDYLFLDTHPDHFDCLTPMLASTCKTSKMLKVKTLLLAWPVAPTFLTSLSLSFSVFQRHWSPPPLPQPSPWVPPYASLCLSPFIVHSLHLTS